jgi:hypothetical protein
MGTTTIPPDAAGVETAGGIQVASLDPDAGISVEDPDEVIRDEAVAETATGDETEEAVSTAPTGGWTRPFAVDPRTRIKEVDALTTRLRQEGKHDAAAIVEARFERDIKIQTEYDKSIKTAEDRAVVDQFYKLLGETPEDQRFDIPENLFRSMTNATLQRSMQLAAEAHNTAAEKLGDERALQLSNQTLQELTGKYLGDEELSSQVDAGERPELPGLPVIGEAFDYRTPITGAASTKRDRVDFPANDPLVLALNKDDRAEFETRVNAYNQRLDEDKSFERPAPWSMQDMATFDAEFEEAVTNTDAMLENNADPEARAASTSMRDFIKNKGFITDVKSAAMAMMPLNEGMDPEVAYRTALAMAMANHRDPIHSQFRAQRMLPENGYPAGTLMVTQIGNDTPIYIPEHLFKKIDNVRQQVATDFLRGKGRYAMGKAIRPPDRPPSTAGEQMLQNPAESRFGVLPEMLRGVGIEVPEEEESAPYPPPANRFGNIRNPFLEK